MVSSILLVTCFHNEYTSRCYQKQRCTQIHWMPQKAKNVKECTAVSFVLLKTKQKYSGEEITCSLGSWATVRQQQ